MATPTNIFVLCTGRCGSTTLATACAHFTNYTAGHETLTHRTGPARFRVPTRHIEVDNRLSWLLGRLDRHWGDSAAYVHLTRDPAEVAESFRKRAAQGILRAYRRDIIARSEKLTPKKRTLAFCRDYVDTVTENIRLFLRDKSHVMDMRLETIEADFDRFIDWIGAEGDLDEARETVKRRHNASGRGRVVSET